MATPVATHTIGLLNWDQTPAEYQRSEKNKTLPIFVLPTLRQNDYFPIFVIRRDGVYLPGGTLSWRCLGESRFRQRSSCYCLCTAAQRSAIYLISLRFHSSIPNETENCRLGLILSVLEAASL